MLGKNDLDDKKKIGEISERSDGLKLIENKFIIFLITSQILSYTINL